MWEEIAICGSGESAEWTTIRIPMLSPSSKRPMAFFFLVKHSIIYGISLGKCNSPNLKTAFHSSLQSSCPMEESAAWNLGVEDWENSVSVTEFCGSIMGAIFPSHIWLQTSYFICPNLSLIGPDKHYWSHPDDSLRPCHTTKVFGYLTGGIYPWTFAKEP